eukprot:jgi/Astpho2/6511/Aster-08483
MAARHANVPGLFYHLLRLTAYLYNIEYVIVYTSPGSSLLHQVILMSSDGFFIPSGVDLECRRAIDTFGSSLLLRWWNSFRSIRDRTLAGGPTRYVLPDTRPKFLGVVFMRVGQPGAINPPTQFWELAQICQCVSNILMPALTQLNLTLPPEQYEAICAAIAAVAPDEMPAGALAAVHGIAGYIIDYHRLQHMALTASVPVPYLQPHMMWRLNPVTYEEYLQALQNSSVLYLE